MCLTFWPLLQDSFRGMETDSGGDRKAGQSASAGGWYYAGADSRTSQTLPHGQTAHP